MAVNLEHTASNELIIHPGESLFAVLQDRNLTLKELALKTGFSEKHLSLVISGEKDISAKLANKLESALCIPTSFWRNLQKQYVLEVVAIAR